MVGIGLAVGAVGAAMSLAAGLAKTFGMKPTSESILVQIHDGNGTIEKSGSIRSDQVPRLLEMIDEVEPAAAPTGKR